MTHFLYRKIQIMTLVHTNKCQESTSYAISWFENELHIAFNY
jgi:hypothetical protein